MEDQICFPSSESQSEVAIFSLFARKLDIVILVIACSR